MQIDMCSDQNLGLGVAGPMYPESSCGMDYERHEERIERLKGEGDIIRRTEDPKQEI